MLDQPLTQTCACPCGDSQFVVRSKPFARFFCHCTICQSLYQQPYADATVLRGRDVTLPEKHGFQFRKYRSPPAVNRGICPSCNSPIIALLGLGPFFRLAFTASRNYSDQSVLPAPGAHIFYERRVADISDAVPKYSGYWRSEFAVWALTLSALAHGSRDA